VGVHRPRLHRTLKTSEPADVLGLNAAIFESAYEVTAEMLKPGQANFIASSTGITFLGDEFRILSFDFRSSSASIPLYVPVGR
jgi:hypothetical protein